MSAEAVKAAKIAAMSDFKTVFGTETGKRVLKHLIQECGLLSSTLTGVDGGRSIDPYEVLHREGRRDVGLYILQVVEYPLEDFIKTTGEVLKDV